MHKPGAELEGQPVVQRAPPVVQPAWADQQVQEAQEGLEPQARERARAVRLARARAPHPAAAQVQLAPVGPRRIRAR